MTTCGAIVAKCGARTIAAAENTRAPPERFYIGYVVVGAAMPAYLTLE